MQKGSGIDCEPLSAMVPHLIPSSLERRGSTSKEIVERIVHPSRVAISAQRRPEAAGQLNPEPTAVTMPVSVQTRESAGEYIIDMYKDELADEVDELDDNAPCKFERDKPIVQGAKMKLGQATAKERQQAAAAGATTSIPTTRNASTGW